MAKTAIHNSHGDEIVEIQLRDSTGRKIDSFSSHGHDEKTLGKRSWMIYHKYGIDLTPRKPKGEIKDDTREDVLDELWW